MRDNWRHSAYMAAIEQHETQHGTFPDTLAVAKGAVAEAQAFSRQFGLSLTVVIADRLGPRGFRTSCPHFTEAWEA